MADTPDKTYEKNGKKVELFGLELFGGKFLAVACIDGQNLPGLKGQFYDTKEAALARAEGLAEETLAKWLRLAR